MKKVHTNASIALFVKVRRGQGFDMEFFDEKEA
jgi:hypothetical protein